MADKELCSLLGKAAVVPAGQADTPRRVIPSILRLGVECEGAIGIHNKIKQGAEGFAANSLGAFTLA